MSSDRRGFRFVGAYNNRTQILGLKPLKQVVQIFSKNFVHALPDQMGEVHIST